MKLKTKFYSLVILMHGILLVSAYFYLIEAKMEFLAVELFLLCSLWLFLGLIKKVLAPFEYVDLFSDVLNDEEFTTRFSHTGNRELDNLMTLFNQMLSQLYEERLRLGDRKGMLQQLMDAIPLSIIVFDYNHNISQLNPAAELLFANKNDDTNGRDLNYIQHPLISKLSLLPVGESALISDSTGKRYRCQRNVFRDRGFDRHFLVIQELTSELKLSEKNTYEKLIKVMSHEVNNTMAATSSVLKSCLHYSDQIEINERQDYENAMRAVIERTDNLNKFMQEYAQFVRLPSPSMEVCDLFQLLKSIELLFEVQMNQQNIHFTFVEQKSNAQSLTTRLRADRNQLEQVLINIIKNAIDAIGEGGDIKVELVNQDQLLILRIKDSGGGISEKNQQDLFTPFFTTKADGQGIGLMLVREILDAHQFEFSLFNYSAAESTRDSTFVSTIGACFEIRFPLYHEKS